MKSKVKYNLRRPLALLLCICMVLPILSYTKYIALARDAVDPTDSVVDGAMWLDDFMKGHPGAQVHGFDDIATYAVGDDKVGVDPGWFNVYVMKMGAESESGPFHLAGGANDADSLLNAFQTGGALSDMKLDYPTSAYTPDNWPQSGAMTWTKQGFVEDSAGFPQMTGTYNGFNFQYAIKSAYLGNSRIFNMGMVTVDGEEFLWISLDRAGATAVILPDTQVGERISLHYAPEEFAVTYSVTVDGKPLEEMTEAQISEVWGDGITTPEQAMTAVIGRNPTTSTRSQTAEVQITVPAGTYGSVFFDDDATQTYPTGDYGNRRLGEEIAYTYNRQGTGDEMQEWCEPNARFSYSEPYSYGEPGKAEDDIKVRVAITTRNDLNDYNYDLSYFYNSNANNCFYGQRYVINSNPSYSGRNDSTIGPLTYDATTDTYNWEWSFRVGTSNSDDNNGLLRLGINGENVNIPISKVAGTYEDTVLSDGSVVRVELVYRHINSNANGRGYSDYKITFTDAKRDIIITEFVTDECYLYGRLIIRALDGVHMQYKYRAEYNGYEDVLDTRGRYANGTYQTTNDSNWRDLAVGGIPRYQTDNRYEFDFTEYGHQIRLSLYPGYVWPGTKQDGTLPTIVNDKNTASFKTDVWADPPTTYTNGVPLTLEMDDPNDGWVKTNSGTTANPNLVGHPYDTDNNNAIWYYSTSLTKNGLDYDGKTINNRIDNNYGRQSFIEVSAIQQTYEIKYLPGITVDNGNVTVTGGNRKYDVPNLNGDGLKADGFKWFVLDENSMPFAGTDAIDDTLYTMQSGSNRALVSLTEPLDNSSVSSAEFQYWVLTDMEGYPVNKNGERVDTADENTWVKYYPGDYIDLPDLDGYTKKDGAAGFQGDDVQRYTITLTAYWGEPETPYTNFVTVNTIANTAGQYEKQFAGTWYNKTDGNVIPDGDTATPEKYKIKVAIPVISFLDMAEVEGGENGTGEGVTVSVTTSSLLSFMRGQGGDNLWYALDDSKNHEYIWRNVENYGELDVWFLYTLGALKISNTIDGVNTGIEFKITFQLPADNPLTAGNESQFFGTGSYKVSTDQGDITLTKGENGEYVGYFTLEDEGSIEFPKLPDGTWYLLELAEDGHNGNNNRGYMLKDGDRGDVYDFSASTVWSEHENTCEDNMTIDKILTNGVVSYGNKGNGIVAYDEHKIDLTVLGTYTVDLVQHTEHPDKNIVDESDIQENVQNFSYITYTVTTKNLTTATQDLRVVLGINSVDISERVDQDGDLDGVRILNLEAIDGDPNYTITETSDSDSEEIYLITLSDGTEIIYDCTGETHTMTWVDEGVESAGSTQHSVMTSVPAVRGLTDYDGTAYVYDTDSPNSVMGEKSVASNEVKARVYSYWLRILAYVVDENYELPAGVDPTFKFRVTLDDSVPDNALNSTIHYMLFEDSEKFGTGNATADSPVEKTLIPTGTADEYYFDFELKHGQRIVIYDLDEDFTYKVVATNLHELDYLQSKLTTNTSGKVNSKDAIGDGIDMVAFHFYPSQSLTVNSTVKAGDETATKKFNYDITLTLPEGLDWDDENPVPTINIGGTTYNLTKQADSGARAVYKVTVPLGNGDSIVIPNIPEATEYSIVANIDNGYSFSAKKGTTGINTPNNTISDELRGSDVYNVTVVKSGKLTLKANVNSTLPSDLAGTYRFKVSLKDADGKAVSGTFQMGGASVTFNNGVAYVTVPVTATGSTTASGSVTITGLPADTDYTVTPLWSDDYMTIDVEDDATGTIGAGAEITVERTFTRLNGSLTINKEVQDYNSAEDGESFKFTVTLTDGDDFVSGTFTMGGASVTFNNGVATVTVPVDETGKGSVTITGIPAGIDYKIVENLDDPDAFTPMWSGTDKDTIEPNGTTATCVNSKTISVEWSLPEEFWFRISDVKYNSATHLYVGNTVSRLEGNTDEDYYITVTNKTNADLPVEFKYVPDAAYTQLTGSFNIGTGDQGNNKALIPGQGTTQTEFSLGLLNGASISLTKSLVEQEKFMSGKVILVIGGEGVDEP